MPAFSAGLQGAIATNTTNYCDKYHELLRQIPRTIATNTTNENLLRHNIVIVALTNYNTFS